MPKRNFVTLADLIGTFEARGDTIAIEAFRADDVERVTYADLHRRIDLRARHLAAAGIGDGDRVLLCAPNGPDWVAAYFSIVQRGAVAVPIDEQGGPDLLPAVVRHAEPRFAFTTRRHADALADRDIKLPPHVLFDASASGNAAASAPESAPESRPDAGPDAGPEAGPVSGPVSRPNSVSDSLPGSESASPARRARVAPGHTASLLYTSGTTGTPKAVPLSHANLAADAVALLEAQLIGQDDRVLMPLPLHHTYPFTVGMLLVLGLGARIIMPSGVTGPEITGAAKRGGATALLGVPSLYEAVWQSIEARVKAGSATQQRAFRALLAVSRSARRLTGLPAGRWLFAAVHKGVGQNLRILGCGGAKLDPLLAARLEALGWTVLTGYGLTETSPVLTFNSPAKRRLGTEGRPIQGVQLRIAATEGADHGEVLAKGPNVFAGYWQNQEATDAAFTADGWFRTGDLGFVDSDGFLHIVGRSKEVIVLGDGKNVFPEEVEAVYTNPLIKELAVLERAGSLVALVVPDDDEVRRRGGLGILRVIREQIETCGARQPPYQRVVDFRAMREPLPRTRLGKLKRHELPALFDRADTQSLETTPVEISPDDRQLIERSATTQAVWHWLEERYPDRPLHPDMSPQFDLKIDSLGWVQLTLELDQRFDIVLPGAAVSRVLTLRDFLNEVHRAEVEGPSTATSSRRAVAAPPPQGALLRASGAGLLAAARVLLRMNYRLEVHGIEHIPAGTCVAFTPNHLSYLDPLVVAAALPRPVLRNTYWAGWVGVMYAGPLSRFVSRSTRVFPVDPDQDLAGAIGTARALLDRGDSVVWFPEGRRSPGGDLGTFRPGVGVLLKGSRCQVVPTYISGTYEAWPVHAKRPRRGGTLGVVFGEAVSTDTLVGEGLGENDEERIRNALEQRVVQLHKTWLGRQAKHQ